jgi:response regulator of citrate/malate metabolism
MKVLIIEDEKITGDLLHSYLKEIDSNINIIA